MEIGLTGSLHSKYGGSDQQRFINVYFERKTNPISGQSEAWVMPRPGFRAYDTDDIVNSTNACGIYFWNQTERLYWVVNGRLYKSSLGPNNTTTTFSDLGALTGITATSGCWFDEFYDGTNYLLLVKCEDGNLYTVTTADAITRVTDTDFTGLTAVGRVAVLDGYVFALKGDGTIAHSDLNAPTTWTATNAIVANENPDKGRCIIRVGTMICCLSASSIEFFRNAGNPTGSVLERIQPLSRRIGLFDHGSVQRHDDFVLFVGTSDEQTLGLYVISPSGSIEKVSGPQQDKMFTNSSSSPLFSGVWAIEGHAFYLDRGTQLAYDISEKSWTTFSNYYNSGSGNTHTSLLSGKGQIITAGSLANVGIYSFLQVASSSGAKMGITNGYSSVLYCVQAGVYADGTNDIEFLIQTDQMDFGTPLRKFENARYVTARQKSSGNTLYLSHSDDGGTTWSTERTVLMNSAQMKIHRCGSFYKRMYRFRWSGTELFLKSFDPDIKKAVA